MNLLALKWRPAHFSDVVGQTDAVSLLKRSVALKRFFPCYLISGPYGAGKTTLARIFSKAILCDRPVDGEPCDACDSCIQFDRVANPNYSELDSASNGSVEDIRRLRSDSLFAPFGGKRWRVVYLDEAGSISQAGNNAFLKLLEEGSDTVIFVMTTTDPDRILDTVKSRAFEIELSRLTPNEIYSRLQTVAASEGISYEEKALRLIATYSQGHMRDALMLLDQMQIVGTITTEVARSMLKVDSKIEYLKLLHALGTDFSKAIEILEFLETRRVSSEIWRGLQEASVDCYLRQKQIETELDPAEVGWVQEILKIGPVFLASTMTLLGQLSSPHNSVELKFNICQMGTVVKKSPTQGSGISDLRSLGKRAPTQNSTPMGTVGQ